MSFFIKLSRYITSGIDDILPNLIQMIKKQKPEITDNEAKSTIKHLWNIIPQGNKGILAPWLVKVWLNTNGYVDENRAILLINMIYKAKNTFPNDFPKSFNINDYQDLDELEEFLDPWIAKLFGLQQKHVDREKSKELGEIVFQRGEYKILRIDDPEDIVKFQKMNDIESWCTNRIKKAGDEGISYFLYRRKSIIATYTTGSKTLWDRNNKPMKDPEAVRIFAEFLKQEGKKDEIDRLIIIIPMTKEEIDDFMNKEKYLNALYEYQKLTPEQIDKAIEKGKYLDWLYFWRKLSPEQINRAIDKGVEIKVLYENQTLTPKNIDHAIEKGEYLRNLYKHQKLTPENIDHAIDKGEELDIVYIRYKLTPKQIDHAIDKGEYLDVLYNHQKLTLKQKKRIEKKLGIRKSIKLSKYIINR